HDDGGTLRIDAGMKMTGRAGPLNIGVLGVRQDAAMGRDSGGLFVGRIAGHVLEESSIGAIVTHGNPDPQVDNSLAGVDFRYLNTRLRESRVLEATAGFQKTETEGLEGDDLAYGLGVEMPNSDGWRGGAGFKTLEENHFPAPRLGRRTDIVMRE